MVKFRAISSFQFHNEWLKPGDVRVGSTSEFEWLRGADCAVKIATVDGQVEEEIRSQPENMMKRGRRR